MAHYGHMGVCAVREGDRLVWEGDRLVWEGAGWYGRGGG